jgi:prepilin-type N-terminal cleavage/methylation domain-containing protein
MKLTQMKQEGFTLIEILMVVLVIGILAAIGITQFVNFGGDAKNAALKANLATLRNGIATQNGLERIRCNKTAAAFPSLANLIANDTTNVAAAGPCLFSSVINPATGAAFASKAAENASYITLADAAFVSNVIPINPWSPQGSTAAQSNTIAAWAGAAGVRDYTKDCANAAWAVTPAAAVTALEYGYCYDVSNGTIWANSAMNDGLNVGTGNEATY